MNKHLEKIIDNEIFYNYTNYTPEAIKNIRHYLDYIESVYVPMEGCPIGTWGPLIEALKEENFNSLWHNGKEVPSHVSKVLVNKIKEMVKESPEKREAMKRLEEAKAKLAEAEEAVAKLS